MNHTDVFDNQNLLYDENLIDELNNLRSPDEKTAAADDTDHTQMAEEEKSASQPEPERPAAVEEKPASQPEPERPAEVEEKTASQPEPERPAEEEEPLFSTSEQEQPGEKKANEAERDIKHSYMIRVIAVVAAVLGVIMLISGIALRRLDEENRRAAEKAQMPEEYINEFFPDDNQEPQIEDYIEPEAAEEDMPINGE